MLSLLLSSLGTGATLIFPLLLTLKALNGNLHDSSPHKIFNQMQYLLNYWICYIVVQFIQNTVLFTSITHLGIGSFVNCGFIILKLWLFYGHGCLFINYYYCKHLVEGLLGKNWSNFDHFELTIVDPLVKTFIVRNSLVVFLINFVNKTLGQFRIINDILSEMSYFYLSIPINQSFLLYSLDYICYIDSPANLNSFILKTKENIDSCFRRLNLTPLPTTTPTKKVMKERDITLQSSLHRNKRHTNSPPSRCVSPRNITAHSTPEKSNIRPVPSDPTSSRAYPISHINGKSSLKEEDLSFPILHVERKNSPILHPPHGRKRSVSKSSSINSLNHSGDPPYPLTGMNNTF